MKNIILLMVVLLITTLHAEKYHYTYSAGGLPMVRVEVLSGVAEIYTNIHGFIITDKHLKVIHKEYYADMTYSLFISKVNKKYNALKEVQIEDKYHWLEYNEYLRLNKLAKTSPDELLK